MNSAVVGIGCDQAQKLAAEVLTYSLKQHARSEIEVIKLNESPHWADLSRNIGGRQKTPFSFQRFLLAGHLLASSHDVAIYVDSDMLVLRPIDGLVAAFAATGRDIATVAPLTQWRRRQQSSVLVFNRAGAQLLWDSYHRYLRGELSYDELIYLRTVNEVGTIPYVWNCLEYLDEAAALIHYTDMDTQPWLRDGNPNAGIWYTYLWRYVQTASGRAVLEDEVRLNHVRPALKEIVELGSSISAFSSRAQLADVFFVPPHRFKRLRSAAVRKMLAPLLRAVVRLQFLLSNGQPNIR